METEKRMQAVVSSLVSRGIPATLEYPDFILIGERAYGTANANWGWNSTDETNSRAGEFSIPSESEDIAAIVDAIASALPPKGYILVWGGGETEQGRANFPTLDAVRGDLEFETDLNSAEITAFLTTGKAGDADPTQFDDPWMRLEEIAAL